MSIDVVTIVASAKGLLRKTWKSTLPASALSAPNHFSTQCFHASVPPKKKNILATVSPSPYHWVSATSLGLPLSPSLQTTAPLLSWAHSHMTPDQLSLGSPNITDMQRTKSPSSGLTFLQNFRSTFLTNFSPLSVKVSPGDIQVPHIQHIHKSSSWISSGKNYHHTSICPSRKFLFIPPHITSSLCHVNQKQRLVDTELCHQILPFHLLCKPLHHHTHQFMDPSAYTLSCCRPSVRLLPESSFQTMLLSISNSTSNL